MSMDADEILNSKYNVFRRFVEEEDGSFILSLRSDEHLGRFLSPTSNDIIIQRKWLEAYKLRESQNKEFYFLFQDTNGVKYGVNRIYKIDDNSFEIGSWLFSANSPEGVSILADLATRDYAFDNLDIDYCRFEVRKANKSVVNYHKRFNPELIKEDEINFYYRLSRDAYYVFRNKLLNIYR